MAAKVKSRGPLAALCGKTVKEVHTQRGVSDQTGKPYIHIDRIVFTDGSRVRFSVVETGCDYAITAVVDPPPQARDSPPTPLKGP